ncbi:type III PLP-dependent enzyme [Paenibacillus cucumis (ex Kampfer et al. 2016)]|uniref:Type III PLP-dependent enzyme n=1 Tax=Paenibacillus cucumis (ex Kampfer et al. 2016) TaxID=1776858 RepID=A0ABS7KL43_9BACL|nr:type III PLP-dependent enzyme [Paenibacillus cucumis (ex Kampfer et al. 2016)]MBY0204691.1 type III PLP-dependent enzyme [Paenibacillus cucumis (ex Kampfer et al. 2016)]
MKTSVQQALDAIQREKNEPICAYIYDLAGIREQVRGMLQTMPLNTRLFYAIKANPDPRIIEALLPLVKGFEVASIGELLKVRAVSQEVPILFGGPGKKESELKLAIEHNVSYIHVESLLELRRIIAIAKEREQEREDGKVRGREQVRERGQGRGQDIVRGQVRETGYEREEQALAQIQTHVQAGKGQTREQQKPEVRVLLRINLRSNTLPQTKIVMGGGPSPFGIDEESVDEAMELIRVEGAGSVRLCGFHFHSLSNNMDARLHAEMIELYLQKVEHWQQQYNLQVDVVNAGGGFGVTYDGSPGFDWSLFTGLLQQSEAVKRLATHGGELLFESGRLLVADHGYYATEVTDIKRSHGQMFVILRGGTHHHRLPASWGHNHPFHIVYTDRWKHEFTRPEVRRERAHIVGELCTPKDRMHSDAEIDCLRVGDVIVFEKSGAYAWTISHHDFLGHPHPAFHYLMEGDEHVNVNATFQSANC